MVSSTLVDKPSQTAITNQEYPRCIPTQIPISTHVIHKERQVKYTPFFSLAFPRRYFDPRSTRRERLVVGHLGRGVERTPIHTPCEDSGSGRCSPLSPCLYFNPRSLRRERRALPCRPSARRYFNPRLYMSTINWTQWHAQIEHCGIHA